MPQKLKSSTANSLGLAVPIEGRITIANSTVVDFSRSINFVFKFSISLDSK